MYEWRGWTWREEKQSLHCDNIVDVDVVRPQTVGEVNEALSDAADADVTRHFRRHHVTSTETHTARVCVVGHSLPAGVDAQQLRPAVL